MSSKRHHAEWLSLVELSGPFLAMPVLERVFPQELDAHDPEHFRTLRLAYDEWEDNQNGARPNPAIHGAWMNFVLKQTLGLTDEVLAEGQKIPQTIKATVSEHGETLRPDFIVRNHEQFTNPGKPRLLIQTYPLAQNLEKPVAGLHWKASPSTRMMELLRATDVPLGLVTNGEQWMLVNKLKDQETGYASWYATLWLEEQITLRALRSLLGIGRFFVGDDETLEGMLAESASHQQDVTDQLGRQVRRAVEVLIQSLDRADQDHERALLAGVAEAVLYEAALTVMMRLVFLFCAEERELLLLGDPLYDQHYAVSTLVAQLQEAADQHGEEVLERRFDAWGRLLSTFRAVFGGVQHKRMSLRAYAGSLFNPDRFPFLEGRTAGTSWRNTPASPLPVNNRTVLHLLRSLQYLEMHGEARRISFRALEIENIGTVYEGLLDHTAKRASEPILGLVGAKGKDPEVPLVKLEQFKAKGDDDLIEFLVEETGRSESPLRRALESALEAEGANKVRAVCGNDDGLFKRVRPFAGLLRNDTFERPVVIRKGSVFVTAGTDRRSSGTHYTPTSLTEPIVKYTLEPLVYDGPAEGKPREEWKLKSARELLDLKICDMACGSGAFLVQACRYLAERLMEAWQEEGNHRDTEAQRKPEEHMLSSLLGVSVSLWFKNTDAAEQRVFAMRLVAHRCLYGVDKNPLAAEMAKLSLWLLTLARDKPFTFLDHAIRSGDSLVGIHDLRQLKVFNLDPETTYGMYQGPLTEDVDRAIAIRRKIAGLPTDTAADVELQEKLLEEAEEKIARLHCAADLLISVEFQPLNGGDKDDLHNSMAIKAGHYVENGTVEEFQQVAKKVLNGQPIFHWPLEFPEVFVEQGGFDVFVGNPPFLPGPQISVLFGPAYRDWVKSLAPHAHGNSDLVCYFFLRAFCLARPAGGFGLLATKSIREGDSRKAALNWLLQHEGHIHFAHKSVKWPGGANVSVAAVCLQKGKWAGRRLLDNRTVDAINDFLDADSVQLKPPAPLASCAGKAFRGSILAGEGFVLSEEQVEAFAKMEPQSKHVIFPVIGGEDLNSRFGCEPNRYAINVCHLGADECRRLYPLLFKHLELTVKVERATKDAMSNTRKFWRYWSDRPKLQQWVRKHKRVLAISQATKHICFAYLPTNFVLVNTLNLFTLDDDPSFAVMQSTIHCAWALAYATSLESGTVRYTYSTCFETFPFPNSSTLPALAAISIRYQGHRSEIARRLTCGLTEIYNRFHSPGQDAPDIQKLRELHVEMDRAVAAAYGWPDLDLGHGFHATKQGLRFTISEAARREVLGRLLKLNHERYAEEVEQGLHDKKKPRHRRKTRKKSEEEGGFFG